MNWSFDEDVKRFRPILLVIAVLALGVIAGLVELHLRTKRECAKILALKGRTGALSDLVADIRPGYILIDGMETREEMFGCMTVTNASSMLLIRFNGEGIPYYWGWAAYDTNTTTVVDTEVRLLW